MYAIALGTGPALATEPPADWVVRGVHFHLTDPKVAAGDFDRDGVTNLQEWQHGTDPVGQWTETPIYSPNWPASEAANHRASQLNDRGEVFGIYDGTSNRRIWLWSRDGAVKELPMAGSLPSAANNWGQFVGGGKYGAFHPQPGWWVWPPALPSNETFSPLYFNDLGQVLGRHSIDGVSDGTQLREFDGTISATLPPDHWPLGMNNYGEILGIRNDLFSEAQLIFLHFNGQTFETAIPTTFMEPSGSGADLMSLQPDLINDHGEFSGFYITYQTGSEQSFFYDGDFHHILPPEMPSGWYYMMPHALNNAGQIVVYYWDEYNSYYLLWRQGVSASTSSLVGRDVGSLSQINDAGEILAYDYTAPATERYLLLIPANDRDGDGMSNDWETIHNLDPDGAADALVDSDGDGASNLTEYLLGKDPWLGDSGQGPTQGVDMRPGIDSDGDGIPNTWEVAHGFDPNWATDATMDYDHDGYSNLQEFTLGTNPLSVPLYDAHLIEPLDEGGVVQVRDMAVRGTGGAALVVGSYTAPTPGAPPRAFAWTPPAQPGGSASLRLLEAPAGVYSAPTARSSAEAVAPDGTVYGWAATSASAGYVPVVWPAGGGVFEVLSVAGPTNAAYEVKVGENGVVVLRNSAWSNGLWRRAHASAPFVQCPVNSYYMSLNMWRAARDGRVAVSFYRSGQPGIALWRNDGSLVVDPLSAMYVSLPSSPLPNGFSQASAYPMDFFPDGSALFSFMGQINGGYVTAPLRWPMPAWLAGQPYTAHFPLPAGTDSPYVSGVSVHGETAGTVRLNALTRATVWSRATATGNVTSRVLPPVSTGSEYVSSINAVSEVTGYFYEGNTQVPVLWSRTASGAHTGRRLNTLLRPGADAWVVGITRLNDDGHIWATGYAQGKYGSLVLIPSGDTDGDGLPDGWEITHGFNTLSPTDGEGDADGDGLSNLTEYRLGSHPRSLDSDGDGMPDAWEVTWGLDPASAADKFGDPDGDLLANTFEHAMGSNPIGLYNLYYAVGAAPVPAEPGDAKVVDIAQDAASSSPRVLYLWSRTTTQGVNDFRGWVWTAPQTATPLPALAPATDRGVVPVRLLEGGDVVGWARDAQSRNQPVRWAAPGYGAPTRLLAATVTNGQTFSVARDGWAYLTGTNASYQSQSGVFDTGSASSSLVPLPPLPAAVTATHGVSSLTWSLLSDPAPGSTPASASYFMVGSGNRTVEGAVRRCVVRGTLQRNGNALTWGAFAVHTCPTSASLGLQQVTAAGLVHLTSSAAGSLPEVLDPATGARWSLPRSGPDLPLAPFIAEGTAGWPQPFVSVASSAVNGPGFSVRSGFVRVSSASFLSVNAGLPTGQFTVHSLGAILPQGRAMAGIGTVVGGGKRPFLLVPVPPSAANSTTSDDFVAWYEQASGRVWDPEADDDVDGLTNGAELALGTDVLSADTDGDGFFDGHEFQEGAAPLVAASHPGEVLPEEPWLDVRQRTLAFSLAPSFGVLAEFVYESWQAPPKFGYGYDNYANPTQNVEKPATGPSVAELREHLKANQPFAWRGDLTEEQVNRFDPAQPGRFWLDEPEDGPYLAKASFTADSDSDFESSATLKDSRVWLRTNIPSLQPISRTYLPLIEGTMKIADPESPHYGQWEPLPVQVGETFTLTIQPGHAASPPHDILPHIPATASVGATNEHGDNLTTTIRLLPVDIVWNAHIEWKAQEGYNNVSTHRDPFTGQNLGQRIFPDWDGPSGTWKRDVLLSLHFPGCGGRVVYLKSFDVDDPTPREGFDPNGIVDPNDSDQTQAGSDNLIGSGLVYGYGDFTPGASASTSVILDSEGRGTATFRVGAQPGNNYRVAAALEQAALDPLQVSNSAAANYVTADDAKVPAFAGVVSPMLTVWRYLHIEQDSMEAVDTPKPEPDRIVVTGSYWEKNPPGNNGYSFLHITPNLPDVEMNHYLNGSMTAGGQSFLIAGHAPNLLKIFHGSNLPPDSKYSAFIGSVEVRDDDERGTGPLLPNDSLISEGVKAKFRPAFIEVVNVDPSLNQDRRIPFQLYANDYFYWDLNDAQEMEGADSVGYWYHYVLAAYQAKNAIGQKDRDGDPDGESFLLGLTPWTTGFGDNVQNVLSMLFLETIRDDTVESGGPITFAASYSLHLENAVAHEIGHVPRGKSGHYEPGLMGEEASGSDFAPESIRRFRKTSNWSASW